MADEPRWPCGRAIGERQCVLALAVTANAKQTEVVGLHDEALRVKLAAPPVDGKANAALVAWLASELGLAKRDVRVRRGAAARHKQVEIDAPLAQVNAWLARCLGEP
jgi:uncharacterized protein (TIGR00251 family)